MLQIREKGEDLTQSCDKTPYTSRIVKNAKRQYKHATKKADYTAIADRLRTVKYVLFWGQRGFQISFEKRCV